MSRYAQVIVLILVCGRLHADTGAISEARDLVARGKTAALEAGAALAQGDQAAWGKKSDESRRLLRSAARLYREAGAESTETVAVCSEYAAALELARDFDLAAAAYARCVDLEPEAPQWHLKRGLSLIRTGEGYFPEAMGSLGQAIALAPGTAEAAQASGALGDLYFSAGHFDLAEPLCRAALENTPGDVAAAGTLASVLIRRGAVVEADRTLASLTSFRGDELRKLHAKIARALQEFDQNRIWIDDTAAAHTAYGRLLRRAGRHSDAVRALRRAETLAPAEVAVLNLLGSTLERAGDAPGARAAYERSLLLNPDQPSLRKSIEGLSGPN